MPPARRSRASRSSATATTETYRADIVVVVGRRRQLGQAAARVGQRPPPQRARERVGPGRAATTCTTTARPSWRSPRSRTRRSSRRRWASTTSTSARRTSSSRWATSRWSASRRRRCSAARSRSRPSSRRTFTLDEVATHAVDFWLSTEDLGRPENRVTLTKDGSITLSYTPNNQEPKERLYNQLKSMLGHLGMHPDHLIPRTTYLKNEIPIAGVAHQAGTVRFGTDPGDLGARPELQGARAGQPVRRRHQLLPEHRRGEPGPHGDRQRAAGRATTCSTGSASRRPTGASARTRRRRRRLAARRRRCPSMASRPEVAAVYGAALVQGVALVTFPAASSILTSPSEYALSSTAYGALFLPQAIAAISAALAGARLTRSVGVKRVFLAGLVGDLAAMTLLVISQFAIGLGVLPYLMLLVATTCLGHRVRAGGPGPQQPRGRVLPGGRGPGGAVPQRAARAGHGAGAGAGRAVPRARRLVGPAARRGAADAGLLVVASAPAAPVDRDPRRPGARSGRSCRRAFWLFAGFALLYGIVETTSGNWSTLYMTGTIGTLGDARVDRAHDVLGDGHGRPGPVRRDRAAVPGDVDVPAAAVRGRRRARAGGAAAAAATARRASSRSAWPASGARRCCR